MTYMYSLEDVSCVELLNRGYVWFEFLYVFMYPFRIKKNIPKPLELS